MSTTLGQLMERNVLEVFGERDPRSPKIRNSTNSTRSTAHSLKAEDQIMGREALNSRSVSFLKKLQDSSFRLAGPAEVNHDHGRLRWHFGLVELPPVVTGMDVAVFKQGRISSLYAFLTKLQAPN